MVTADCVDEQFGRPVIDSETDVDTPIPHRQISGHFEGTDKKFTFYYPPDEKWQGRFFQHVYPTYDENADPDTMRFAVDSGGYLVATNGGGGYRVDAAAAKFSKVVAQRLYDTPQRIYGYIWGGSGGSYQTIAAMENTIGVWDGGVPYIPGDPSSIPNNFFIRVMARMILQDKAAQISDAVAPGSTTDPYTGLDEVQRAALAEITRLGMPLQAWEDYPYVLGLDAPDKLLGFTQNVMAADPTYVDDFWSKPGYLGTEDSPMGELFRAARVDQFATVKTIETDPTRITLDSTVADAAGMPVDVIVYDTDGVTEQATLTASLEAPSTLTISGPDSADLIAAVGNGTQVRLDNHVYLAMATYPRYQVPVREDFEAYDQYRQPDGTPMYPQRPLLIGPSISESVSDGGQHTGNINGKMIVVGMLLDADAFPWHGDWYSKQVRRALHDKYDDQFRLWYTENADHIAPPRTDRLIDYTGILQQALRDISAWVEHDVPPAPSTRHSVHDGQVSLRNEAGRGGIQPAVTLTADGNTRAEAAVGQPVHLQATVELPADTGSITQIVWNPTGFGPTTQAAIADGQQHVVAGHTVSYGAPGTYFPQVSVRALRDPNGDPQFADVRNIGRMRIVVGP